MSASTTTTTTAPPPTTAPGFAPAEAARPLAAATHDYYHAQYGAVLAHLQEHRVLVLASDGDGLGKSHLLVQAAEQLVQGAQLVFLHAAYVHGALHPSIEHAIRQGGVVVLTSTHGEHLRLLQQVLAGLPLLPLHHPQRPGYHEHFRLVLETTSDKISTANYYAALAALTITLQLDPALQEHLLSQAYAAKMDREQVRNLLALLPDHQRQSLHLPALLATGAGDRVQLLAAMLRENGQVSDEQLQKAAPALAALSKRQGPAAAGGGKRAARSTQARTTEADSPAAQQAHLRELAAQAPTVVANPEGLRLPPVPVASAGDELPTPPPPALVPPDPEPYGESARDESDDLDDEDYGY